jgi:uncharacterized metal-binding protein YceD (DUF177 family)
MMKRVPKSLRVCIGIGSDEEISFEESLSPDFLDVPQGDELQAISNVEIVGRAYRVSEWIVVEADVKTSMGLPCSTCNEQTTFPIVLTSWKQNFPEEQARDGTLDITEALREAILLEVPLFVKCGGNECKNIDVIRQYLTSKDSTSEDDGEERNQPFLSLL